MNQFDCADGTSALRKNTKPLEKLQKPKISLINSNKSENLVIEDFRDSQHDSDDEQSDNDNKDNIQSPNTYKTNVKAERAAQPKKTQAIRVYDIINDNQVNDIACAKNSYEYVNNNANILKFWLAFVAFCDSITIKHNDSRLLLHSASHNHTKSNLKQSSNQDYHGTCPITSRFKIITSKKFIFLFVICVFLSLLNQIEARPNLLTNAITDSTTNGEGDTNDAETVAVSMKHINALDLIQPRSVVLSAHDEDNLPHMERYPLAQVDFEHVRTPFIIGAWIFVASLAKIGFHMMPKLHSFFPESCLLIVLGIVVGIILYFGANLAVSPLTPNTFFLYMLPPIILDAGYFMPNRLFFDNLGTILLMAVFGTIFNIVTIGGALYTCGLSGIFGDHTPKFLDLFLFSSLISAVDPVAVLAVFEEIHVNEILYIIVFGESLLNDAVTVVMYNMMDAYNQIGVSNIIAQDIISGVGSFFVVAIGGTVIGIIWGFLTGLVTRFTNHVRVIEPIFIFVMAYLAYLNAEIFHMSGILAITFCGITMKNYVNANISQKSQTTVKYGLKMLSSSSETIIFMFLGVATVNNNHVWNTWFVVLTIVFCIVFRIFGVIILTALANRFRLHQLSAVDQVVMSYGGLRGAVAFALVLLIDERLVEQKNMFVTTTIAVIYFTVFLQGITIKPLVEFLNVKRASKCKPNMNERMHGRFIDHLVTGIEDIVNKTSNLNLRHKIKRFDNRFIRPLLIRDYQGHEPKIFETFAKLMMRDAIAWSRRTSSVGQMSETDTMSAIIRNNSLTGSFFKTNSSSLRTNITNSDNVAAQNLDVSELGYTPSKKDINEAQIHHLIIEELKPYKRHPRFHSKGTVHRDLSAQVNYKTHVNYRRVFHPRQHEKRRKNKINKQNEINKKVSFHKAEINPTENCEDEGLTLRTTSSAIEQSIHDTNVSKEQPVTPIESLLPWRCQNDDDSFPAEQNNVLTSVTSEHYVPSDSASSTSVIDAQSNMGSMNSLDALESQQYDERQCTTMDILNSLLESALNTEAMCRDCTQLNEIPYCRDQRHALKSNGA